MSNNRVLNGYSYLPKTQSDPTHQKYEESKIMLLNRKENVVCESRNQYPLYMKVSQFGFFETSALYTRRFHNLDSLKPVPFIQEGFTICIP